MEAAELLAPLAHAPERSALVLDVDGTLAPIAPRPELAFVPEETHAELVRLAGRYLLVACVSGRSGEDARRLVGVDGIEVVGNHGLDLDPGAHGLADPRPEDAGRPGARDIRLLDDARRLSPTAVTLSCDNIRRRA